MRQLRLPTLPSRGTKSPTIGYLFGNDRQKSFAQAGSTVHSAGNTDIHDLPHGVRSVKRLHVPGNYLRSNLRHDLSGLDAVVNLVTDPDLNPGVLAASDKLLKPFKGKVLNPPRIVLGLTRDRVARVLDPVEGLTAPATARFPGDPAKARAAISGSGMTFPALLREVGSHSGETIRKVDDLEQALAALEPARTYYLTCFVDTRGEDGLYRKLRAFCFAGRWVLRHSLASDHWIVHASDRVRFMADRAELIAEEASVVAGGVEGLPARAQAALEGIRSRLGLDFFGVDFALLATGGIVVFEANATMNFLPMSDDPRFAYMETLLHQGAEAVGAMMEAALDPTPAEPVVIRDKLSAR